MIREVRRGRRIRGLLAQETIKVIRMNKGFPETWFLHAMIHEPHIVLSMDVHLSRGVKTMYGCTDHVCAIGVMMKYISLSCIWRLTLLETDIAKLLRFS